VALKIPLKIAEKLPLFLAVALKIPLFLAVSLKIPLKIALFLAEPLKIALKLPLIKSWLLYDLGLCNGCWDSFDKLTHK